MNPLQRQKYEQFKQIMFESGARCTAECPGPESVAGQNRLEFWATTKGLLIAQIWTEGDGITALADWPLGHSWNDLRAALQKDAHPQPDNEDAQEILAAVALVPMVRKLAISLSDFVTLVAEREQGNDDLKEEFEKLESLAQSSLAAVIFHKERALALRQAIQAVIADADGEGCSEDLKVVSTEALKNLSAALT